ncbi:MAG: sigma-54 dependent transcriptional regulator [Deltaproteobacteria bacterium]|nr:sigma-54 dependent transcriptional regulator [Deltaproteobacteria bacterium]
MASFTTCSPHPFSVSFPGLIGRNPAHCAALDRVARVALSRIPVLVLGESGTGKELFGRAVAALGPTPDGPCLTVNCGALPRELIESELFGHERGAFTGAGDKRIGWFEAASGGTLILDEIGELPLEMQPKLLRVLETGRFTRVGGRSEIITQTRVVAMTNRDLRSLAQRGEFRLDLYHRLSGVEVRLPPLRERKEDIPLLVDHFVREWCLENATPVSDGQHVQGAVAELFLCHDYPGNVRELRNLVRRALCLHGDPLQASAVAEELQQCGSEKVSQATGNSAPTDETTTPLRTPIDGVLLLHGRRWPQIEGAVFKYALQESGGNYRGAARLLGISRSTFNDRARRMGM